MKQKTKLFLDISKVWASTNSFKASKLYKIRVHSSYLEILILLNKNISILDFRLVRKLKE